MGNSLVRKTKDFTPGNCPVVYCMNIIGGKWKPSIIHMIRTDRNRYSILLKNIPEISKQTLTNQLRELEADEIIEKCNEMCKEIRCSKNIRGVCQEI